MNFEKNNRLGFPEKASSFGLKPPQEKGAQKSFFRTFVLQY